MNAEVQITGYRESFSGTDLVIHIPEQIGELLLKKCIHNAEIRLDDGRHISAAQRKKIYATIRDIADYTGYMPISIHTLLAESDSKISQMFHITHRNFAHLSHILYIYFLF